jgi:hypothetical protein
MSLDVESQHAVGQGMGAGRGRRALVLALGLVLVFIAYVVGTHRSATRVLTGPADVGDHVVTMTVDGVSYGFAESVPWIDRYGSHHDGGWPDCLGSTTSLPAVTFGVVRVDYSDRSSGDQVAFVDCRPGPGTFG